MPAEAPTSGQASVLFEQRMHVGSWPVKDGLLVVNVEDETREGVTNGLEYYPETVARYLTVLLLKQRSDRTL